jgi:copper resistance protein C
MKFPASCLAVLLALAAMAVALAHAEPAKVSPGDGALLTAPPPAVEIEMSQELARQEGANDIDVLDISGNEVTTTAAVIDNGNRKKLSVALPSTLAPGQYTVKWKSLSADDGDPAQGQLKFTFDPAGIPAAGITDLRTGLDAPAATPPAGAPAAPLASAGGGGTSWILVAAVALGMFVMGGGTAFLLVQKRT